MSLQALLSEYDHEMAGTRKTLAAIPPGTLAFRPHDKSWTAGELATHVANVPNWLLAITGTSELDLGQGFDRPTVPSDPSELVSRFDAAVAQGREALSGIAPASLSEPWTLRHGTHVIFTLPRGAVIRSMVLSHMIHHRGQLTVYLRLLGAAVPGLYGPSADEA